MRCGTIFLLLGTVFLLAGCRGPVVMINGEPVEVLTPKEELELACTARSSLVRSKILTPEEKAVIKEKDPEVRIVYSSSRTGDATISWQLPGRWVAVFIRGTFFTPSAQWMMKIRDNQPEWLDLRGQKPAPRKKK
ncbi:MAG: hypothetical protein IJU70_11485 [Lentisphaeria bacterium]|nr:hypothetical protein [Lentisphaeria bacterium]